MKVSSGLKVGILTIAAVVVLLFTVLWVKGRSISNAERITVAFKDVNGLRAGSGVHMMGVRIGQVESLTPKMSGDSGYVEVKFVITEPNVDIPAASSLSIQQTGIIGELFLEITPPKVNTAYVSYYPKSSNNIKPGDKVELMFEDDYHDIGTVQDVDVIEKDELLPQIAENIKTEKALKVGYTVKMSGLKIPDHLSFKNVYTKEGRKLSLISLEDTKPTLPPEGTKFTVIEPMRTSDFMALQYRSAKALAITNEKLSYILSEDVMDDIKRAVGNVELLTQNANIAVDKTNVLLDMSKTELETLATGANELTAKLNKIADSVVKLTDDEDFAKNVNQTMANVNKLSGNLNNILEEPEIKTLIKDIAVSAKNVSDISTYINDMTKDEELKKSVQCTVNNLNTALGKLTVTLDTINYVTEDERENIKQSLKEVEATTANLKKFSAKLNKRFLLWRLMF